MFDIILGFTIDVLKVFLAIQVVIWFFKREKKKKNKYAITKA